MTHRRSYALFSAQYPPHLGGIENFTQGLAKALVEMGNDVTVVTNDTEKLGEGLVIEDGVNVLRLPCIPLVSGRFPVPLVNRRCRRLLKGLESTRFDGVLVNARFYIHSLIGMRLARKMGLRPVVLDHGSAWLTFSNPALDPLVRFYECAITTYGKRNKAAYYGISQKSADWLATFGIQAEGVIPNAIDAEEYCRCASGRDFRSELELSDDAFIVAFAGRLIPEKGVKTVIEASEDQALKSKHVVFVLAGDGPMSDEVREAQGESLKWVGRLCKMDTAALFNQANVMCLPSRSEGFSTTLLEASACGCPSIVTDVGGARELIPNGNFGTIIPDMSSSSLVGAVLSLLGDRKRLMCQAKNVRERCASYSKRALAEKCVQAFERAC